MKHLPRIDAIYWLMIISANTIGESGGDLVSMTLKLGYAASTAVLIGLFLLAVLVSVVMRVQHAVVYWIVIILSSTAGTTMSDLVTRNLFGTPEDASYGRGSAAIFAALVLTFAAWRWVQPRQRLGAPLSRPAEILYWLAILASSTLGTAFGDFISDDTGLGFGAATLVLVGCLAVIAALYALTKLPRAICYWMAISAI